MVKDTEALVDIESNQSDNDDDGQISSDSNMNSVKTSDDDDEYNDIESLISGKFEGEKRENMPLLGRTQSKERQKVKNSKKAHAPKPPRPRRGPTLSANDLRLVKEISELVMKKRARIERLKSLKKLRSARSAVAASSSSSSMSVFALMITVLFLIVIILQGFGSRTTGLVWGQFDSKLPK